MTNNIDNEIFDYVVIGSGFGGSVSAMRLAEKGYRVLVLERGKRYRDQDFARSTWNVWKYLWLPAARCFGILQISPFRHLIVLHGSGVGGGSLVNISSSAGVKGTPLHVPYTAAKHGIVGMSRALANELAAQSIRVNTVHPTGVMTGMAPPSMHEQMTARTDLVPIFLNALPAALIEAVDVSNAVLFLVSDESRYVTGLEFKVDAGVSIR